MNILPRSLPVAGCSLSGNVIAFVQQLSELSLFLEGPGPHNLLLAYTRLHMSNYDDLRRQCRTLESRLDAKLTSYSRLAANIGRSDDLEASGSNDRWRDMEEEIDGLLEKVRARFSYCKPPAHICA